MRDGGGGGGCSILGTVRQLRGPSNDDDAALFRADIAVLRLLRLSSRGMGGPGVVAQRGGGRGYKRERAWRGAAAPRISHLYPCPAYIAGGDNSARAPGTVSLHGFPGYNILGYLASRPRGLEIPTLHRQRVTVGPPSSRRSPPDQPLLETMEEIVDASTLGEAFVHGKWPIPDLIIPFFLLLFYFILEDLDFFKL